MERGELTGAILDGRYRVIEPVAEGAMGVVYRAERVKLGRIVAVKVLHDVLPNELSARKRFEIEAMAMAKLEHPHCASVLDVGMYDDRPYVVMDFVSGHSLKDVVAEGPQPLARAAEIVRQVLSGLAHAHELGIIHRDIKPANIVLSQKTGLGDHVKILDFGLARLHDTGQNLTTGIVVGTPAYMAPEQIRGILLDHRVDLYACGILLFELLTGEKPFHSDADDPIEVCRLHLSAPIPRLDAKLPGVAFGALETVVATALAKDADDRYATAQAFVTALDAAVPRRPSFPSLPAPAAPRPASAPRPSSSPPPSADASYPPPLEVRSGDVMSALTEMSGDLTRVPGPRGRAPAARAAAVTDAPSAPSAPGDAAFANPSDPAASAGLATDDASSSPDAPPAAGMPSRTATPAAGMPSRTATPVAGVPQTRAATRAGTNAAPTDPATPVRTFLGIAMTPPPSTALQPMPLVSPSTPSQVTPDSASVMLISDAAPRSPAPTARPPRPRQLIILAAGALLLVVITVALATRHSASPPAPIDAGVVITSDAPPPVDPTREVLDRANDLIVQGNKEAALDLLTRSRRQYPDNAELAYAAGRIYFSKYYWTDGIQSFRDALRRDPRYRTDPELIKTVLRGFLMTPSPNQDLASFLRDDIGAAAAPFLEETARDHPNAELRRRAAAELRRYH